MISNPEKIDLTAAQDFTAAAMESFDHLLLGENAAKRAVLHGLVGGFNVSLPGDPGGGKTTLGENVYRIFTDVDPRDVVIIPAMSDLRPEQVVGGQSISETQISKGGIDTTEQRITNIRALLSGDAKFIFADEINRTNPYVINSLLGGLAMNTRKITTTAGTVTLPEFQMAIATHNPAESPHLSFPIAVATASRFAIGAVLGEDRDDPRARHDNVASIMLGTRWEPNPNAIAPFTSTAELNQLRAAAKRIYLPSTNEGQEAVRKTISAIEALKSFDGRIKVSEADGRFATQVANIASVISLMDGSDKVSQEAVDEAIQHAMTARLGLLTRAEGSKIRQFVKEATQ